MLIRSGINPNCSEIVVYLNNLTSSSSSQELVDELTQILSKSKVKIGAINTSSKIKGKNTIHPVPVQTVTIGQTDDDEPEHRYPEIRAPVTVRDLELGASEIVLYMPSADEDHGFISVQITVSGVSDDLVLMTGDYDRKTFPILAEVIRAMGYSFSGHDGGGTSGFVDWCNNNGYEDVAIRSKW